MKPFIVMDIVKKAKEIEDVIHLEIGEPDLLPPPGVKKALQKALKENRFSYTPSKGLPELREKIAAHYKVFYNIDVNPNNILITTGTSTAFLIALYFSNKIATPTPGYPCYENFAKLENKEFIKIKTYKLTPQDIPQNIDTLLISSPNNPTGSVYNKNKLKEICEYCQNNNITLISDELYHGLIYEEDYTSTVKYNKNAIVINGFSKFFCMPGLRIGWIIVPDKLLREAEIIAQNILISAPILSQYAALEAFDYNYLESVKKEFKKRKDFLYEELKELFPITKPKGAFYLWCDISEYNNDSLKFCNELLTEAKVAVTPGIDFGDFKNFIRIAYTKDIKELEIAVKRIKKFLN